MRGFRPEWARKLGERKARECGFDSFPIDPFAIAADEDILSKSTKPLSPELVAASFLMARMSASFTLPRSGVLDFIASPSVTSWGIISFRATPRNCRRSVHCMHRRLGSPQAIDLSKLKQITFRLVCFSRASLFATPSTMRR